MIHAFKRVIWARPLAILNQGRGARKYARALGLRAILIETPERTITLRDLANRHNYDQDEVRALAKEFPDTLKIVVKALGTPRWASL